MFLLTGDSWGFREWECALLFGRSWKNAARTWVFDIRLDASIVISIMRIYKRDGEQQGSAGRFYNASIYTYNGDKDDG